MARHFEKPPENIFFGLLQRVVDGDIGAIPDYLLPFLTTHHLVETNPQGIRITDKGRRALELQKQNRTPIVASSRALPFEFGRPKPGTEKKRARYVIPPKDPWTGR